MRRFLTNIQDRLNNYNQNFIAVCVGGTGSGKSYAMLKLAECIDPGFSIERVVFSLEEFIELLTEKKLPPGSVIVWDEGGVEAASRESMTKKNRLLGKIIQTFRHRNLALLFTVPDMSFVDVQIRSLSHVMFKPNNINRYTKTCNLQVSKIQRNEKLKKTYIKPYSSNQGGEYFKVSTINLKLPSKKLRDSYEQKKTDFTHNLNLTDLEGKPVSKKQVEKVNPAKEIAAKVLENKERYLNTWRNKLKASKQLIQIDFNVGRSVAAQAQALVETEVNR